MNRKILSLLIMICLVLPISLSVSDIFYPKESNIKKLTVNKEVAIIKTKDGKCFMYKLKDGKTIGFKTCYEKDWEPVE